MKISEVNEKKAIILYPRDSLLHRMLTMLALAYQRGLDTADPTRLVDVVEAYEVAHKILLMELEVRNVDNGNDRPA